MTARLTLEYVRQQFENEGHTLLSTEYINSREKLDYICPRGHQHSITWSDWSRGKSCYYCYRDSVATIEEIRQSFYNECYILLTTEYNSSRKLDYICPKGHKYSIKWGNWKKGNRCIYCHGAPIITTEIVKQAFKKEGYILVTPDYINAQQKLYYICPEGHKHYITWSNWQRGHRCPFCYWLNCWGENSPNWKGGIATEPYCSIWLDKDFKESIKARDGYMCMNPLCRRISTDLCIHHVDYNKKNCHPNNLITLCRSCNSLANSHREWYTAWYQRIIEIRYGNWTRGGAYA